MNGTKSVGSRRYKICVLPLMKSIPMLGKWQCCGENDCFKQEILSGWNVPFKWGLRARSWAEPGEVALLVQERSWGRVRAPALAESCCQRDHSAPRRQQHCCYSRGIRGVLLSQHKLPELLLHQLKVGPGPYSPPQAETLLIYSHGPWGHPVSPDEMAVCRRMSRHT